MGEDDQPVTKIDKNKFGSFKLFAVYKEAAKRLDHPNISIPIALHEDDQFFYITHKMPSANSQKFQDYLNSLKKPLDERSTAFIAQQLFHALTHSHL